MTWYDGGMAAAMWAVMSIFWLLLIGAIAWLAVVIGKLGRQAPTPPPSGPWDAGRSVPGAPPGPTPLEVLDQRLASGEIDLVTYQQTRAALLASSGGR
ncbi:SHOCT domain-containing protein [Xylanimonas sp. McL0601]|uniref:SHOCT domain-containing protein n=1 Tax=Xylanimonas sp. McL0601 TaxID=3414739 RepID=UPI003CF4D335